MNISLRLDRVLGLALRTFYVYTRTGFRAADIVFWPVMDLFVWGFVSTYFMRLDADKPASAITFLIGGIIFFNLLYRAQQSVSLVFLEEMWSRNLINIFVAPITVVEFMAAAFLTGFVQIFLVGLIMSSLAFVLYSFNLLTLSFWLIPLFLNLLFMGWALGMGTAAVILRYGHQAEALAWAVPFLVQPISAVFYPVSVLPAWLQPISYMVPSTYVFEGMRHILAGDAMVVGYLLKAGGLNLIYWTAAIVLLGFMLANARERGSLAKLVS